VCEWFYSYNKIESNDLLLFSIPHIFKLIDKNYNIDYDVDPISISQQIEIPIQGGLDPKILLSDKENLKKETLKYLNIFKDHPYIFNLGHGVVPETNPERVKYE
jgi:uroporphyrinogen-III decarboxylase